MPKVAVITGAGAGVGRATVDEFARQGFDVALLSRDAAGWSGRLLRYAATALGHSRYPPMSPMLQP